MTDITSKIRKKNDTFPKPLKINKKLIYFAEQIANEFNFLQKSRSRTCGNNCTILTNHTEYLVSFNEPFGNSDWKT